MGSPWVIALVLLIVGFAGYKVLSGGIGDAKFVIRVAGPGTEGVHIQGEVPGHPHGEVADFIAGLELPSGTKIWGLPDRDRIQLRFSNEVPENLQQRLRNFFYN